MATALVIEEESGTCGGFVHPHNGYYAGDSYRADPAPAVAPAGAPVLVPVLAPVFGRITDGDTVGYSALRMVAGVRHVDDRAVARAA